MTAGAVTGLRDAGELARRSLLRARRAPRTLVLAALLPLLLLLVFGYVLGGSVTVPGGGYPTFLVPGVLVQAVALVAGLGAASVAGDVRRGMVDRFRGLPVTSAAVLFGATAADLVRIAVTVAVAAAAGVVAGWRVHTGAAAAAAGFGLLLLFGYAVTWAALLTGLYARSPGAARRTVYACLVPLTFVSGALAPTGTMPPWLRPLAEANPVTAVVTALRTLWGDPTAGTVLPAYPLALLWPLAVLLVTIPLARRRYRRTAP
ncbi:ABC transporter permease [Catellatospora sp. NPDC049609]|uniref:ABC transporter permease n=1 Tax=Catellatospora sp. NPDC049609 TaxID=3155505 RepID=UPI003438381B